MADRILATGEGPFTVEERIRAGLIPAFHFYIGMLLLASGKERSGKEWIRSGMAGEPGGLFSNSYLLSFLERHGGKLVIPETIFSDPAPYMHFASTPMLVDAKAAFRIHCIHSLPRFTKPVRIMDIGCGHGVMLVELLNTLKNAGTLDAVEEVLLIDPSKGMLHLAVENVRKAFPEATVKVSQSRMETFSDPFEGIYDLALSSLAFHHMPYETKRINLQRLKNHINHFVLFEVHANHDTPEMGTPELALSVYQVYGGLMDFIFAHDAPVELAISSIDKFLMSEEIFFFLEPRGKRSDYHMLRSQWHELFREGLGDEFSNACDSVCFGDGNIELFTMIYSR